jgi:Uma2 family endonuclease
MIAMSAPEHRLATSAPTHLLTIEEYLALGETEIGYTELLEGRVLMSPSPTRNHMKASGKIYVQLLHQLPADLEVVQDLDIDLELRPRGEPGHSRRPDLIIYSREAEARHDAEGGLLRASEILVAIEIVSRGSLRTDRVTKHREYADAGIPHYWMVNTKAPASLVACHLTDDFTYRNDDKATGTFTTTVPFPFTIDLDALG